MSAPVSAPSAPTDTADKGPAIVACCVVLIVVPTIAVGIRVWSRIIGTASFWWDDWAILATLLFSHLFLATNIWWTTLGLGKHALVIPLRQIGPNDVANHVALVWYATAISLIKISALTLYARLFKTNRQFRATLRALGGLVTVWWIVVCVVPWTFCHPVKKTVDPFVPGTCGESSQWFLASAFINAFLDLVVLILPMPVVWKLHMKLNKKILVSTVFLLGYCSAFLSFARFIIIVRRPDLLALSNSDPSWNLVPILYLSMLEAPFAMIALCGPSINQLVHRSTQFGLGSLFDTRRYPRPLMHETERERRMDGSTSDISNSGSFPNGLGKLISKIKGGTETRVLHREERLAWSQIGNGTTTSADGRGKDHGDWNSTNIPMGIISVENKVSVGEDRETKREIV